MGRFHQQGGHSRPNVHHTGAAQGYQHGYGSRAQQRNQIQIDRWRAQEQLRHVEDFYMGLEQLDQWVQLMKQKNHEDAIKLGAMLPIGLSMGTLLITMASAVADVKNALHAGEVDKAQTRYQEMIDFVMRLPPGPAHFMAMVFRHFFPKR